MTNEEKLIKIQAILLNLREDIEDNEESRSDDIEGEHELFADALQAIDGVIYGGQ